MPLPPSKPPAPPPEPHRVPDLPPLLARARNPVPLLIEPLHQRKEERPAERPAAENPDDQQQLEGEKTHKTLQIFSKSRKQPDCRQFAQLVNMAKFEAVLVRQRTDDTFWQVARTFFLRDYPFVQIALFKKRLHILFKASF